MSDPPTAVEVLDRDTPPAPAELQQIGIVPSANYRAAIEIGHVAAASQLYPEARTAARAAMVVMIGMDLGITPATALMGIHISESKDGRVNFLIESKVLAGLIERRPGIEFKVKERTDTSVTLGFYRDGELLEEITWDEARAVRAGLWGKPGPWQKYPREMLTWRAIAEGTRLHFPEVLQGQRLYVEGELADLDYRKALEGPQAPPPLGDEKAEALRAEATEIWRHLNELNPERMVEGKLQSALRRAAHSHTELELTVQRLATLLEDERGFQGAAAAIGASFGEDAMKDAVKVANRRGSMRESIESLQKTHARLGDEQAAIAGATEETQTDDD